MEALVLGETGKPGDTDGEEGSSCDNHGRGCRNGNS